MNKTQYEFEFIKNSKNKTQSLWITKNDICVFVKIIGSMIIVRENNGSGNFVLIDKICSKKTVDKILKCVENNKTTIILDNLFKKYEKQFI